MTQQDINKHVGKRIQQLRKDNKEPLKVMEEKTGIDDSRLSRLELGQQKITIIELDLLKRAYGLKDWSYFTQGRRGY